MNLNRAGREYAHWDYSADFNPTGSAVQVNLAGAWYPAASVSVVGSNPWTGTVTLLVAGPDAASNPGGTVVLAAGSNPTLVRFPDTPEMVVRDGGTINVNTA